MDNDNNIKKPSNEKQNTSQSPLVKIFLLFALFLTFAFIFFQYYQYKNIKAISCGGDWDYNTQCPLGTYCKATNQKPMSSDSCQAYLSEAFESLLKANKQTEEQAYKFLTPTPNLNNILH